MLPSLRRPGRHSSSAITIILLLTALLASACNGPTPAESSTTPSIPSVSGNTQTPSGTVLEPSSEHAISGDHEGTHEVVAGAPPLQQIRTDLVGQQISQILITSSDQIVDVIIEQKQGQVRTNPTTVGFPATLIIEEPQTQERYQANVLLIYKRQVEHWTLESLATNNVALLPEPIPSPPQAPVALGEPARVGAFTVLVHGIQMVNWREQVPGEFSSYREVQRLLVDISIRNDTRRMVVWPRDANFTVLSEDGTALNAEYADIQMGLDEGAIGLLPSNVQTDACTKGVADLLRPVTYLKRLLPGEVTRRWLSYQQAPGFEQDNLQLEISLPGPQGDEQHYHARFLLHGVSHPSSLPPGAAVAPPVVEGRLGVFVMKDAQIGPIGEIQDQLRRDLMPCTSQRTVTVCVENTAPNTEALATSIWLVDADGRMYEPLPINDRYSLEPRQTQTVSFVFPALLGVRDQPVSLLLGEASLNTTVRQTDPPQRLLLQLTDYQ